MHTIEPYHRWRDDYDAAQDRQSPFYGREYDEFSFSQKIYNYFIHPQWDFFGSPTLYVKQLFTDYEAGSTILEFIGEWNDAVTNDIMYLKRDVIEPMMAAGIHRFVLICENVLNFHGSDDCYYEEWFEEIVGERGWIALLNLQPHVWQEMRDAGLDRYMHGGPDFQTVNWRPHKPHVIVQLIDQVMTRQTGMISDY